MASGIAIGIGVGMQRGRPRSVPTLADIFGADLKSFRIGDSGLTVPDGTPDPTDPIDAWAGTGPNLTAALTARPLVTDVAGLGRCARWDGVNDSMLASGDIQVAPVDLFYWDVFDAEAGGAAEQALMDAYNGSTRVVVCQKSGTGSGNVSVYDGSAWREIAPATTGLQALVLDLRAGTATARAYRSGVQIGAAFDYVARALTVGSEAIRFGSHFDGVSWPFKGSRREIGIAINPSDARRNLLHARLKALYPALGIP